MNKEVQQKAMNKASTRSKNKQEAIQSINKTNEKFTHEENKLLRTLLGITLGSVIMWTLR